ncbi:MAG: DUF5651 domain-containing protein [Desulfosporosinus sp.]|nr:DUF5651 domain-containing protein [Desulfosporosinus sp.]
MGKQYLNREEKNQAVTISAFVGYLDKRAEEWIKHGRDKKAVKYLRMAKSFADKALDYLYDGLNPDEKFKLILESLKMDVAVKYKDEAQREYKRTLELDSVTPIKTNDLLEIVSYALADCYRCKKDDPSTCKLRKLYITYDIPVYDEDPPAGRCPYKV